MPDLTQHLACVLGDISVGISIILPFLTISFLARRIERISGVRSYWPFFIISIIFYVVHLFIRWLGMLNIVNLGLMQSLYNTATLLLATLSVALGMVGVVSLAGYNPKKISLVFTFFGVTTPIAVGIILTYFKFAPFLPYPTIQALLQGFLAWTFLSLAYFFLQKLCSILEGSRYYFPLIASLIYILVAISFLYSIGGGAYGLVSAELQDVVGGVSTSIGAVAGLIALYSSFRLAKETNPLPPMPLEVGKLETGVREIDDLLKGGIPYSSSILLLGVATSGKTNIFLRLVHHRLEKGDSIIFVCTNNLPENYRLMMKTEGFESQPFEERNSLIFIDAYAGKFGLESKEKYSTSMIPYDISIAISKAIEEAKGINKIIIIHNLTNILDECGARDGLMFLRSLVAKTREAKATLLLSLNPQAFPPAVLALAQEAVDGTIELKVEEKERKVLRYIRIPG